MGSKVGGLGIKQLNRLPVLGADVGEGIAQGIQGSAKYLRDLGVPDWKITPRPFEYGTLNANPLPFSLQRVGSGVNTTLKPYSLSNEQTRIWYHNQLDAIPTQIDSTLSLREQALQSFQMRNEIKLQARELMSDRAAAAELPEPKTLQDVVRKAYEQGLRGDDVWIYVRDGATRSNKNVDDALGLTRK
ncbi:hypothetical protein [Parvibium lacunae]|uniref:hypothetical protein n=1 Tax=Parvibium lacunae TaxID=1888893 RepID=UPI0013140579|nr:hypothetical protein [Parvibium lacunae]